MAPKRKTRRAGRGADGDDAEVVHSPPSPPSTSKPKKAKKAKPSQGGTSVDGSVYPPISTSAVKTLKWEYARDLMLPFLTAEEKKNVHKKTRADMANLLEARVRRGDVTPEQFWKVAWKDKGELQRPSKPVDPVVAEALLKNKIAAAMGGTIPRSLPPPQISVPAVRPFPPPAETVASPGGLNPYPLTSAPRFRYKYTPRVPSSIWPSDDYPPGVVIGEPNPPSRMLGSTHLAPPSVAGTFYSSAILAIGPDDEVLHKNDAKKQAELIFDRLHSLMEHLRATHLDVISMTAHVVNIQKNGRAVLDAHGKYMGGKGNLARSICAWTMVGVSGLMHDGAVVQIEVEAMIRRGPMNILILDRPGVKMAETEKNDIPEEC
ncbi:hypothetical protein ACHAXT_009385 [Thalassiosira profunda]